jgi:uncharacterized protein DUF2490
MTEKLVWGRRAAHGVGIRGLSWLQSLVVVLLCAPEAASAQSTTQLWGNLTVDWVRSERLVYELDFEPKALLDAPEGEPDWRNLDVTPNVEYSLNSWLDIVAEMTVGRTKQSDNIDSSELTPRLGVRFHLFSRAARSHPREQAPWRRIVMRDLVRFESRNFFYSGGEVKSDFTFRFRNRLELLLPLNKERITDDGAGYWLADWEWFVPLFDDPAERFANRQRIRTGIGYRRSFNWRYELLYIWTRSRETIDQGFSTTENIVDVRVRRLF